MKSGTLLIVVLVIVLFTGGWVAGNRAAPGGWEYKTVMTNAGSDRELIAAGIEGWELVTVVGAESSGVWLYFKRHK